MSLQFFCDHCVPDQIGRILREHHHEVTLLRDVMSTRASDPQVIAKAKEMGAILISLNGDFSDIVTYPPSSHRGIVAIQLHNHPEVIPHLMARLVSFLDTHPRQEEYVGKLLLVEVHRIRIRQ